MENHTEPWLRFGSTSHRVQEPTVRLLLLMLCYLLLKLFFTNPLEGQELQQVREWGESPKWILQGLALVWVSYE